MWSSVCLNMFRVHHGRGVDESLYVHCLLVDTHWGRNNKTKLKPVLLHFFLHFAGQGSLTFVLPRTSFLYFQWGMPPTELHNLWPVQSYKPLRCRHQYNIRSLSLLHEWWHSCLPPSTIRTACHLHQQIISQAGGAIPLHRFCFRLLFFLLFFCLKRRYLWSVPVIAARCQILAQALKNMRYKDLVVFDCRPGWPPIIVTDGAG